MTTNFVAADPGQGVAFRHATHQPLGDGTQYGVAGAVPELSLMRLKWSRSKNSSATLARAPRERRSSARPRGRGASAGPSRPSAGRPSGHGRAPTRRGAAVRGAGHRRRPSSSAARAMRQTWRIASSLPARRRGRSVASPLERALADEQQLAAHAVRRCRSRSVPARPRTDGQAVLAHGARHVCLVVLHADLHPLRAGQGVAVEA